MATKAQGTGAGLPRRSGRATAPQQQVQRPATLGQGGRLAAGVLGASDLLQLQRAIGNRACGRLLAQSAPQRRTHAVSTLTPVQRAVGDALVVKANNTMLHKTKSSTAKVKTSLNKDTLGVELVGRNSNWVKMRVQGRPAGDDRVIVGLQGWLKPDQVEVETGTIDPSGDVDDAPRQYKTLADPLFGEDGPSSHDIQQGGLGDCWLLSPMGALADTADGDALIRDMITVKPNHYEVRFYYHTGENNFTPQITRISKRFPVHSDGESAYAGSKGALWPLVIEKAYAESRGGYFNLSGGTEYNAFAVMTGRFPQGYSLDKADQGTNVAKVEGKAQLLELLMKAKQEDKPITAGIPKQTMQEDLTFRRSDVADDVKYISLLSREPTGRIGMKVKYQMEEDEIERTGFDSKDELDFINIGDDDDKWLVLFKPEAGEDRETIPASVQYFTADLGKEKLVGNHAYMLYDVDQENEIIKLSNPHKSSKFVKVSMADVEAFKISFFVGSVPKAE